MHSNKYFNEKKLDFIPMIKYRNISYYNPVQIAQYGLGSLQLWEITGKEEYKKIFLNTLNWFSSNYIETKDLGYIWIYDYDSKWYEVKKPWISAMAQGEISSCFIRGYLLTNNKSYLEFAEKSFISMIIPVEKGGLARINSNGIWLEEVPSKNPSYILNGFVFAIFGIYDLFMITKKKKYYDVLNLSINRLKKDLEKFDSKYWSYYDLMYKVPTKSEYHSIHINQLKKLYDITSDNFFLKYYEKFSNYVTLQNQILSTCMRQIGYLKIVIKNL